VIDAVLVVRLTRWGPMEIVLAIGAAVAFGTSDFVGGLLSRTAAVFSVVLVSQVVSLAGLLVALPFWETGFSPEALGWGAAAGVAATAGASALYRGLSIGRMGVVAPISGVLAAAIPVVFGLGFGERPGPIALVGVALGLVAVTAVSRQSDQVATAPPSGSDAALQHVARSRRGVLEGLAAGVGFGLFFVLLERSPGDSGLWPLAGMRVSIIALAGCAVAIGGLGAGIGRGSILRLGALGLLNVSADLLYLLATRHGLLSLVAVITSLYPAVTVLLARSVLHERMDRSQMVGLALAVVSVVLIALA
jgi:drug/metabolite transporter (DMT)-like permease